MGNKMSKKELFIAIFAPIAGTIVLCIVYLGIMYFLYTKQDKPTEIYPEKIILKDEKANYGVFCLKERDTIYYVINDINDYKIYSYNETNGITLLETSKYKIYGLTFDENKLYYSYCDSDNNIVTFEERIKAVGEVTDYNGLIMFTKQ